MTLKVMRYETPIRCTDLELLLKYSGIEYTKEEDVSNYLGN